MSSSTLRTLVRPSQVWADLTGVVVLDPDGWDRSNYVASWAEPITLAEFRSRVNMSTVRFSTLDVLDSLLTENL